MVLASYGASTGTCVAPHLVAHVDALQDDIELLLLRRRRAALALVPHRSMSWTKCSFHPKQPCDRRQLRAHRGPRGSVCFLQYLSRYKIDLRTKGVGNVFAQMAFNFELEERLLECHHRPRASDGSRGRWCAHRSKGRLLVARCGNRSQTATLARMNRES